MSRQSLAVCALVSVIAVSACRAGQAVIGAVDSGEGAPATPTPTALLSGGAEEAPAGAYRVELELTYTLVPTVGSEEAAVFTTTLPLLPDLGPTSLRASGEGEILEDITFQVGAVTAHNVADWVITVQAALDPALGDEPLTLDFGFAGSGYGSVQEVRVGAHMDSAGAPTYEHTISLPLQDGASKSFDVEGWTDVEEWTVTLHLR